MPLTRRRFLSSAALLAAAPAVARPADPAPAVEPPPHTTWAGGPPPATPEITAETVAQAERLAGVAYTPAERQLLAASYPEQLAWIAARRRVALPDALAPATIFDPLLPGGRLPRRRRLVRAPGAPGPVPRSDDDLAFASVAEQSAWIRAGRLTSARLTDAYLARLERLGPKVNCTVTLLAERARAEARDRDREAAAGRLRGPLHGIPYGVKDLLDTAGIPTTWGAEPYRARVPDADAPAIARLREAGAVLVAKLSLGALAMNDVWFGGMTRNPWLLAEGSSGSSAGSGAAVAAGLVGFAIGSETLGSIVSPSMRCGTAGLRPTFGRIPRGGAMTLCWSLDKLGPMTRAVEDAALVLAALDGAHPSDPSSRSIPLDVDLSAPAKGLRAAYDPAWFAGQAAPGDREALEALRALGVTLVPRPFPDLPWEGLLPILFAESAASFEALTLAGGDDLLAVQAADAWPNLWRRSRFLSAVDHVQADRLRRRAMEEMDRYLEGADLVATPSFLGPMLLVSNYTGHPSLTLRTGFQEVGRIRSDFAIAEPPVVEPPARVPHGFTLVGRLFDEGTILRAGRALEAARGVWRERPPGF
jgi:Asp-tRNA(Asn)/Glu-tRNA(Gln) amidotransferase A subunit family amidase